MKDKRIKVLVATPHFSSETGGVSSHTYNLYKRLVSNYNCRVVVVTTEKKGLPNAISGMKIYKLPVSFKLSNTPINPLWFFSIKRIINNEKPDVVIGHTPVPFLADMAALASSNTPYLVKYHHAGSMVKGSFPVDLLIKFYESTLLKYTFNKSRVIIASSDFLKNNFLKRYLQKTVTITPGVDMNTFEPKQTSAKNRIMVVTNMNKSERYKGLKYILKAMPLILKIIDDAKLIIVGDKGDDTNYYKSMSEDLGIEESVIFKGKLPHSEMVGQYQNVNVEVLPSLFDSCPNMLLEAMATKLPVVGTSISGIPYLIKDGVNGFLFPPKDYKKLAEAVVRILSDPKKAKKMGENGYEIVKAKYGWDKQVKRTHRVIVGVLNYK